MIINQTWQTHFVGNSRGGQRYVGFCFLDCAFWMLIGWANKLQSLMLEPQNFFWALFVTA